MRVITRISLTVGVLSAGVYLLVAAPRAPRGFGRNLDAVARALESEIRQSFGDRDWINVHDRALEWIDHDDDQPEAWLYYARASEQLGARDEAADAWTRLERLTRHIGRDRDPRNTDLDMRAWALQGVGHAEEARALWSAAADNHSAERPGPWRRSRIRFLILAGRTDEALTLLEILAAGGWSHIPTLRDDVDLDSIRDHPRFLRVYEQVAENARARREAAVREDTAAQPHVPPLSPDPLSQP